ncbi:MAG: S8 family serine peptidase [Pseudomonadota bacterium]
MPNFTQKFMHVLVTTTITSLCLNAYGAKKNDSNIAEITSVHIQQQRNVSLKGGSTATTDNTSAKAADFKSETGVTGIQTYIIRLKENPVAQYKGGVTGLAATSLQSPLPSAQTNVNARGVLNAKSSISRVYADHLVKQQLNFQTKAEQKLGRKIRKIHNFKYAFNGISAKMTQDEAARLASMPDIVSIERDVAFPFDTVSTPRFIGATNVWNGIGTGLPDVKGEGMLVGMIDAGIDHTSKSFAAIGDDGYAPENPFGNGIFLGECLQFVGLCNNKLVGSYTFLAGQVNGTDPLAQTGDPVSKDTDGHGSHTASIAAGNLVNSATVFDFTGKDTGVGFGPISGIAPHANIIAYKVCAPRCFTSDIISAVDQAIVDGVDAINHSIGSSPTSPWEESKALAFLNARAAGIMVQNSAGNTAGAGQAASSGNAPWVTGVAWSTHDRDFGEKYLQNLSGGDTTPPANIPGRSLSGSYTGPIVSAGNFINGDANPIQCLVPFPAGSFTNQIVVCDRGGIARTEKCANVAAGGAKGCVLANVTGQATSVDPDMMPIPAININAANGDALKLWLSSGTGHTATISESSKVISNPALADIMSPDSSAGPYTGFDFLAPSVAAPGIDIFAAGANLHFLHPGFATADPEDDPSVPGKYGIISGSSMAAPHLTGSAILLKQLHPDWTPAEILSAFMTTGQTNVRKADGVNPADPFDMGGGRVQVDIAARAALVFDETAQNFFDANPKTGGDPSTLNIASLVQDQCNVECSWTRTVTATANGSWTTSAAGSPDITVSPANFELTAGQTQVITVTARVVSLPDNIFSFGQIKLTPKDTSQPTTTLPLAVKPASATNPSLFTKVVDKTDAGRGEKLKYTLTVNNPGDQNKFSVTDLVPKNSRYVSDSATELVTRGTTTARFTEANGNLTWSGILDASTGSLIESASPFGFVPMSALGVEPLGCPNNCDDGGWLVNNVNISYFGKTYNEILVSVNGAIELGTVSGAAVPAQPVGLPHADDQNNILAPFWADFNLGDGGQLYSVTLTTDDGTAFDVVSWEDIPLFDTEGKQTYSFQIWSQQGTENIWFVYGLIPQIPPTVLTGFENSTGNIGATYFFSEEGTSVGTLPAVGVDLKTQTAAGGTATLTFDAIVSGPVGGSILNEATMTSANGSEKAIAYTTINNTGIPDTDGDDVYDDQDNCTKIPNPNQCDSDSDGYGNLCDADFNNNGFVNKKDRELITKNLFTKSKAPQFSQYDMNCSGGRVDLEDYFLALIKHGTQPGPSGLVGTHKVKNKHD